MSNGMGFIVKVNIPYTFSTKVVLPQQQPYRIPARHEKRSYLFLETLTLSGTTLFDHYTKEHETW